MTTSLFAKLAIMAVVSTLAAGCVAEEEEQLDEETASTESALSGCPSGWACIYQHSNFGGRQLSFKDGGCQNLGNYGFNDKASSLKNRTGYRIRLYKDSNCRGSTRTFDAGESTRSFGGFGDEASSIRILR